MPSYPFYFTFCPKFHVYLLLWDLKCDLLAPAVTLLRNKAVVRLTNTELSKPGDVFNPPLRITTGRLSSVCNHQVINCQRTV